MMREFIKKEIHDHMTSLKFVFTLLLCVILILLAVYTGINNYQTELKEYNLATELNKKNLENQPNYYTLASTGTKINKPPVVLSTIVTGIQDATGRIATVNATFDPNLVDSKFNSNPIFAIFGTLDLTFIVKLVLSLFAILFTYDIIVGEKEKGTLKLALSNNVPRVQLILGKAVGGFISLLIPLLISILLSLIILAVYPDISLTEDDWIRIILIFLLFFLYLLVFFSLGILISSRTGRSSTSFLVLLFIWVTSVAIIPKAAVMISGQVIPVQSIHEITAKKDAYLQQVQSEAMEERRKYIRDNPMPQTPEEINLWREKVEKWGEQLRERLLEKIDLQNAAFERDYQTKLNKQQKFAVNLSRISPSSALMYSVMSLARTGVSEHERFLTSLKDYKPLFTKWLNSKTAENPGHRAMLTESQDIRISDMPVLEFIPENLNNSVSRMIPDILMLVMLVIVFFTGAYVSFLRYDVR